MLVGRPASEVADVNSPVRIVVDHDLGIAEVVRDQRLLDHSPAQPVGGERSEDAEAALVRAQMDHLVTLRGRRRRVLEDGCPVGIPPRRGIQPEDQVVAARSPVGHRPQFRLDPMGPVAGLGIGHYPLGSHVLVHIQLAAQVPAVVVKPPASLILQQRAVNPQAGPGVSLLPGLVGRHQGNAVQAWRMGPQANSVGHLPAFGPAAAERQTVARLDQVPIHKDVLAASQLERPVGHEPPPAFECELPGAYNNRRNALTSFFRVRIAVYCEEHPTGSRFRSRQSACIDRA